MTTAVWPWGDGAEDKVSRRWTPQDNESGVASSLSFRATRAKSAEDARHEASEYRALQAAHAKATDALMQAKADIRAGKFEEAVDKILSGLDQTGSVFPSMQEQAPKFRWDLEQWLLVARMRENLQAGHLTGALKLLKDAKESSHLGAALDVSAHEGLEEALQDAEKEMEDQLSGLFEKHTADITRWTGVTVSNVALTDRVVQGQADCIEALMQGEAATALDAIYTPAGAPPSSCMHQHPPN